VPLKIERVWRSVLLSIVFVLAPLGEPALAKIGDPAPLVREGVSYRSHAHTVRATDVHTQELLWETVIPMSAYKARYDPSLEEDAQWNVITSLEIEGNVLVVTNSKGQKFRLDRKSGKPLKKTEH
jgi:hypothetical protein